MIARTCTAWLLLLSASGYLWGSGAAAAQSQEPAAQAAEAPAVEQADGQQPPDPQLKINPLEAMRRFEPPPNEEYRLGRGDEITIEFTGRPEMQARLVVGPDGRITLPLAGDLMFDGLTRGEAAKAVEAALEPYYSNLACQIIVNKYTANRVLLIGAVDHPGLMTFDGPPTLLGVITRGLETGPNKIGKVPERCAVYRGQNQVVWVKLKELLESGNPLADLHLRRDDVVYVPSMEERFVSVLGEVNHPGAVQLTDRSTLASVLAEVGGMTGKAGNKPHLQIVDPADGSSRIISFNDLLNPAKSSEITLKPGQIIFVPQSGLYRATYILERISPIFTLSTMAAIGGTL